MTNVARHRRERGRRRGAAMTKCYVCGRVGPRRSMVVRKEQLVCRKTAACMDRVLAPPTPESSVKELFGDPARVARSIREMSAQLQGHLFRDLAPAMKQFVEKVEQFNEAARLNGWQPLGYPSDEGIQQP